MLVHGWEPLEKGLNWSTGVRVIQMGCVALTKKRALRLTELARPIGRINYLNNWRGGVGGTRDDYKEPLAILLEKMLLVFTVLPFLLFCHFLLLDKDWTMDISHNPVIC
jgi:hypothetical protein